MCRLIESLRHQMGRVFHRIKGWFRQPKWRKPRVRPLVFRERVGSSKDNSFVVRQNLNAAEIENPDQLPIPDADYMRYAESPEQHLRSGKRDFQVLRTAACKAGLNVNRPGNVLELGCANARVMRWLLDWTRTGEVWGVDIDSEMIFWCHENLSPPFHFAVSTTAPSLFFGDGFFSLVYCYSIFTHIDDLYLSWVCELRRVLEPKGVLCVTIHDESAERKQVESGRKRAMYRINNPSYQRFKRENANFVSVGRDWASFVSFRRDYAIELFSRYFEVVEVLEETMGGTQTMLVLRKK